MTSRVHRSATTLAARAFPSLRAYLLGPRIARERRHLARLDDHLLRDIGIARHEAEAEASRPVWDAPARWIARPDRQW